MLRVTDLQRAIDFYTRVLGMTLLRTTERPEQKYSLAFVGYGSNPDHAEIELTYNHGVEKYDIGSAYGHIAIGVKDIYKVCEDIRVAGGTKRQPRSGNFRANLCARKWSRHHLRGLAGIEQPPRNSQSLFRDLKRLTRP